MENWQRYPHSVIENEETVVSSQSAIGEKYLAPGRQLITGDGWRISVQDQVRLLDRAWKVGAGSCRIQADGSTPLRIPEARVIDWSSPGTFHNAHETVLALYRGFVTATSQNHDLRIARYGLWRRTPCQGYLRTLILHKILVNGRHVRVRRFSILPNGLPRRAKPKTQCNPLAAIAPTFLPRMIFLLCAG